MNISVELPNWWGSEGLQVETLLLSEHKANGQNQENLEPQVALSAYPRVLPKSILFCVYEGREKVRKYRLDHTPAN